MARKVVYVALQQFCETDEQPRRVLLEANFDVRQNTLGRRLRRDDLLSVLQDADAVLAGVEPYDAELLSHVPRLRCISRCGAGTDSIDLEAAHHRGIAVYTTAEEVVEPVAQMTLAMILALARNLPLHAADARAGHWTKRTGALLTEWTIGVVGFGRIGRKVAQYLRPFEPRLLVHDPALSRADVPEGVELTALPVLLTQSDLVSIHVGRRQDDGVLIGRSELSLMKPGSFLVNTARGFLVDEAALYDALRAGRLAGAAVDVFHAEPNMGPLAQLPNVLCTPHVASLTRASRAAMELWAAQHILECFARRPVEVRQAGGGMASNRHRLGVGRHQGQAWKPDVR